jgi:esterase/lipase
MGDEIVPWSHAVNIYRKVGEPKRLLLLEEGDHRFVDNTVRNRLLDVTVDWFRKWLLPQEAGCA